LRQAGHDWKFKNAGDNAIKLPGLAPGDIGQSGHFISRLHNFSARKVADQGSGTTNHLSSAVWNLYSFRMQGFYLIAGFFSMMLLRKYGPGEFIKNRLLRLGIPLFFIGFMFNTVMEIYIKRHINSFSDSFSLKYILGGHFLNHLWFLPNLFLFCCLLWIICKYFPALPAKGSVYLKKFSHVYLLLLVQAVSCTVFLKYFPKGPYGNWFIFNTHNLGYYSPFFIIGVIFYLNKKAFADFRNSTVGNIAVLILAVVLPIGFTAAELPLAKYVRHFSQFPIALSINGILLQLAFKFFNQNNKLARSISAASYTMYLLHLPLLQIGAFYLIKSDLNNWSQFIILLTATWCLAYMFHFTIVARFPVATLILNGQLPKKRDYTPRPVRAERNQR
jgi:hypothetical protein